MKKFEFEKFDAFVSEDMIKEFELDEGKLYNENLRFSLSNFLEETNLGELVAKYLEVYSKVENLPEKYAFLWAHGASIKNKWYYCDGNNLELVQKWTSSNDGKYSGLIYRCCNPGRHIPYSRKSALIVPDHYVKGKYLGLISGKDTCFEIFSPRGIKTDSYTIEYDIKKLEEILDSKNKS